MLIKLSISIKINILRIDKNATKTQVIANSDSLIKRNDLYMIKKITKLTLEIN